MKTIMFTGVSGVGKTTLVSNIANELKLPYGDYGDFMLEVMHSDDRNAIQHLSSDARQEVYRKVRQLVKKRFALSDDNNSYYLLSNHLTIIKDGEIISFPNKNYWQYNMSGMCVIYADPKVIIHRRKYDYERDRIQEDIHLIDKQQKCNDNRARSISEEYHIPILIVENKPDFLPINKVFKWVCSLINGERN